MGYTVTTISKPKQPGICLCCLCFAILTIHYVYLSTLTVYPVAYC